MPDQLKTKTHRECEEALATMWRALDEVFEFFQQEQTTRDEGILLARLRGTMDFIGPISQRERARILAMEQLVATIKTLRHQIASGAHEAEGCVLNSGWWKKIEDRIFVYDTIIGEVTHGPVRS